ncbi:MAG: cupin-like domain-containing protein [Trichormus sp. ATA11-4-KO1]|jgi:hypothetical protein|nr:cupin-like domain-containing protein [Trichormus sp. ATA11-4-KO1]
MITSSSIIDKHYKLSHQEFISSYVKPAKPVIISGLIENWDAFGKWSLDFLQESAPEINICAKEFTNGTIKTNNFTLKEYTKIIKEFEIKNKYHENVASPPYCHDIPLFSLVPHLIRDVQFPTNYLPKWYTEKWWRYCQFFIGASNSLTPLHFDCLLTNNLFFQIVGRKKFTILTYEDKKYCYRYDWRWFKVNPENPDFDKYPKYKNARPIEIIVNPGDILYMPPGTLHHVRSLDMSISFNIDWHTNSSVINSLTACLKGMPMQNVYYNFLLTLGLVFQVPPQIIFKFYKTYLNYIS